MKTKHILMGALALSVLTACEDYTEKNFGSRDELYQPTQVNHIKIDLADADYAKIADNATNKALAAEQGLAEALQSVADKKYFRGGITPEEYLLPMLQQLVGKTQYYTMTAGSTITVNCLVSEETNVSGPAYVPVSGDFKAGKYLLAPIGQEQILGTSGLTADGEHPGYGYLYLTGGDKCPAITRINDEAITIDATAKEYIYAFDAEGDAFTIRNAAGYYLYLDGSHASFQYTDDLQSDCDEPAMGLWTVSATADGAYEITNCGTGQQLRYDTSYKSAGCYSPDKQTANHVAVGLYKEGKINVAADGTPELTPVIFSLDEDGWAAKVDYINMALTGMGSNTTDADAIFDMSGWSIEAEGGIGELTYVWRLDPTYGLRASAYANSTYTVVDVMAISPALNLKKAKSPLLRFDEAQKYAASPLDDFLQVWVSTDYTGRGGRSAATWVNVTDRIKGAAKDDGSFWTRPDGSDWTYATMNIDLSEFAGQPDVRVAFRYITNETSAATWEIKNVVCKEAE